MKKLIIITFLSLLFAATLSAQTGSFERIEQNFFTSDTNTVMVVCHRAHWRSAPENSIPAIENAIKIGADMVEIDVRKSSDGVFVLMHDATVNRTTNGTGTVAYMTLSQLKSLQLLDLANGGVVTDEQIPTLEEALQVIKGNIMVNLDSKVPIDDIYPLLDSLDIIDHVLIKSSQSPADAIAFLNSLPGPVLYMPVLADASDTADIQSYIDDVGVDAFEIIFGTESHPLINENSFSLYQSANVRVWVNTLWASLCAGHTDDNALTDPDNNWGWVMDKGFNIIQSDRPVELLDYLREKGRHRYLLDIIPFDDVIYSPGNGTFKVGGLNNGDYIWFDSDTIQAPVNGENDSTYTKYLNESTTMWVSSISDSGNSRVPVSIILVDTTDGPKAMEFDGSNGLQIPHDSIGNPTGAFSVSCWAKVNVNSGYQSIFTKHGRVNDNPTGFSLEYFPGDYIVANIGNNSSWNKVIGPQWNKGEWHHIVMVYDGTDMELFQDGISLGSITVAMQGNTFDMGIGLSYYYPGNTLKGGIDEVSYWSKALSQTEITEMMHQELVGDEENLEFYYNFNQYSSEGIILDQSNSHINPYNIGDIIQVSSTAPITNMDVEFRNLIRANWSVNPIIDTLGGMGISSVLNYNQSIISGNNELTGVSDQNISNEISLRLFKEWQLVKGSISNIKFNLIEADGEELNNGNSNADEYVLLFRSNITDDFIVVDTAGLKIDENIEFFNYEITNGYHTLGLLHVVGLHEMEDKAIGFKISPNPSNGIFTLEANANSTFTIYNGNGKCILSKKIKKGLLAIDISSQPSGVYFLKVRSENKSLSKKLVLN